MTFFRHGHTPLLIVGTALLIADRFLPVAHDFGGWPVGCLFCVLYSASAIRENTRLTSGLKRAIYLYLAVVLAFAIALDHTPPSPERKANGWLGSQGSLPPVPDPRVLLLSSAR